MVVGRGRMEVLGYPSQPKLFCHSAGIDVAAGMDWPVRYGGRQVGSGSRYVPSIPRPPSFPLQGR